MKFVYFFVYRNVISVFIKIPFMFVSYAVLEKYSLLGVAYFCGSRAR